MAGGGNAIQEELKSRYNRERSGYHQFLERTGRAARKVQQAQEKEKEASIAYSDAKVSLHQIEMEVQDLTSEAIELENRLDKRRDTQDDSDMQERQNAKQRLMQIRQRLIALDNQKTACEQTAEKSLQEAREAQNMAAQYQNLLSQISSACALKAQEMQSCVGQIDQSVLPAYKQAQAGFSEVNAKRFQGGASSAGQTVQQKESDAAKLRTAYAWLVQNYQDLANTAANAAASGAGNDGDGGSNAANASMGGKSRGLSERGKQLAVGAMVAASMVTGAAFHATRPASTFDQTLTPMQIEAERWGAPEVGGIQDALTPDDYVSDMEDKRKRDEWLAPQKTLRR